MVFEPPRLITFPKIGSPELGYLSICESLNHVPFDVKRVFWTYDVPAGIVRGHHAHYKTQMVLLAIAGTIIVRTEMPDGSSDMFQLDAAEKGLYLPVLCWHTMEYTAGAVQLVMANNLHDATDYIRSHDEFRKIGGQ